MGNTLSNVETMEYISVPVHLSATLFVPYRLEL